MRIIEIEALSNGGHRNQTINGGLSNIPHGWAVIPDDMEIPATFPFVNIEVEDGVVTAMTEGIMPIPEVTPEVEPEPNLEERVATLETETEELTEALNMILEGKVE